jgi:hypothetical protein
MLNANGIAAIHGNKYTEVICRTALAEIEVMGILDFAAAGCRRRPI